MKVKHIVSEHKKGVRAHIYNKKATTKAQGPVPLYGPDKQDAKLKPVKVNEEMPGQMVGKVQQVKPDGTVDIQKPTGDTTTVQATALQPGDNNKLTMQVPKIQPGMEVDAEKTIEEEPADDAGLIKQYASQLQSMLPQVSQPWEKAQIEARIKAVTQDGWVPKDPNGKAIAVLPPAQWEAKMDPQTVLKICGVNGAGLSPEFKKKMGGAVSQGIMKYTGFEESADNKLLDKMLTIAGLR
jgi:hypothetical protein